MITNFKRDFEHD